MATSTPSVIWYNDTDAHFRAWGSAICSALQSFGVTQTADTGQINWTTVLKPAAANTNSGYEIRQLTDALQATKPVYIKLEFGSQASGATYPCVVISVGTGTDGAGNLTGTVGNRVAGQIDQGSGSNTQLFCGDTSSFCLWCDYNGTNAYAMGIFLERLHAGDGTDNSVGVCYGILCGYNTSTCVWGGATLWSGYQVLEWGKGVPPQAYQTAPWVTPRTTTSTLADGANNVYLLPFCPWGWQMHNPMKRIWGYLNGDIAAGSSFTSGVYGTSRTFYARGGAYAASTWWSYNNTNNLIRPAVAQW